MPDISMESFTLGTIICRFKVPIEVIEEINKDDDNAKDLQKNSQNLASKIAEEIKGTNKLRKKNKSILTNSYRQ